MGGNEKQIENDTFTISFVFKWWIDSPETVPTFLKVWSNCRRIPMKWIKLKNDYSHSYLHYLCAKKGKPRKLLICKSCRLTFCGKCFDWTNTHVRVYGGKLLGLSCWQLQHWRISAWLCTLRHHHHHSHLACGCYNNRGVTYIVYSHVVSSFPPFLLWNASSVLASKASQKVNMARVRIYLTMRVQLIQLFSDSTN